VELFTRKNTLQSLENAWIPETKQRACPVGQAQIQERLEVSENRLKVFCTAEVAHAWHAVPSSLQSVQPTMQRSASIGLNKPWARIGVLGLRLAPKQGTMGKVTGVEPEIEGSVASHRTINDHIGMHG